MNGISAEISERSIMLIGLRRLDYSVTHDCKDMVDWHEAFPVSLYLPSSTPKLDRLL